MAQNIVILLIYRISNAHVRDVVVIGGGISGVAAASKLAKENIDFVLLEAQDKLGGRINTFREGKYLR